MDPNATLEEIRRRMKSLLEKPMLAGRQAETALDLVEQLEALDGWLSGGGFLPKAWRKDPIPLSVDMLLAAAVVGALNGAGFVTDVEIEHGHVALIKVRKP